jgi:hypothetical protein
VATDRDEDGRRDAGVHGLGVAPRRFGNLVSPQLGRAALGRFDELSSGGGTQLAATPRRCVRKP